MYSAMYYPFTGPESKTFLQTSLFLWDSVDFIVPFREFPLRGGSRDVDEALEIIGRRYVPTKSDKSAMHSELEDICTNPQLQSLVFEIDERRVNYDFYPQKLLPETWQMLSQSKLAKIVDSGGDIYGAATRPLFGYYMMSLLAVCCAHNKKRLITDQNDPYRALSKLLVDGVPDESIDWAGRLIALSLSGPDFRELSLSDLVNLRKREDKLLADLRRTFLDGVDKATSEIAANADNPNIVRDVIRGFSEGMELDLQDLKSALRRSAKSLILSEECLVSMVAATAVAPLEPLSGVLVTVGGLIKGISEYRDRRRRILREHPSAWLVEAAGVGPRWA